MSDIKHQMRLAPPYRYDKNTGKKLYDRFDENGVGYFVPRKWYSHFSYKGVMRNYTLKAYEHDWRTAIDNLALLKKDLRDGITPNGTRTQIKNLKPRKEFKSEDAGYRRKWIDPFFGDLTIEELTYHHIEQYMEFVWGRDEKGNLKAMESPFKAHKRVLRQLIHSVCPNYDFSEKLLKDENCVPIKYVSCRKDLLQPLTKEQIELAWESAKKMRTKMGKGEQFKKAFWIMVYTGIEAMDILDLKPKHFKTIGGQEWLIKPRHKTMLTKNAPMIKIPVLPELKKIMMQIPTPLSKDAPFFPNFDNESCNKAIGKYFTKAGIPGYGAKYLRRHLAERALAVGQSETWVQQALGHCDDSEQAKVYMRVSDAAMVDVFAKIAKSG